MSRRSNGLPVAIIAIFLIQILSPVVQFPNPELDSKKASEASEIGFSTGSGHDLEGDVINVGGKNWTVRGESILDYWAQEVLDSDFNGSFDMVVTDVGVAYVCTTNTSEIHFHTIHQNGTLETLLVQELSGEQTHGCAIGVTNQDRIQIVYDISDGGSEETGGHIRLARLAEPNAVYLQRTWHIRTIAEDIYAGGPNGLNLEFDSESRTQILFKDSITNGLRHLWFNKAYWNQTVLDEGPIGTDIEFEIDPHDMFHVVYTTHPENESLENEVKLLRFNETTETRQVLARSHSITDAIGMDLDSNNIEQIAYSSSEITNNSGVLQEFYDISLLRSLAGKDTGRIDPTPTSVITYDDDSIEGEVLSGDLNGDGMDDLVYTDPDGNGTISIHYGSASGVGALADRILVGSFSDSNLGTGIAIGDFNCDGFDDIASSEPGMAINNSGHVSVRLGSSSGISDAAWWEMNGSEDDNLGWSLTSLGDVESDGCDDLAVVADKLIEDNAQASLIKNGLVMILKGNSSSMMFHANITQTEYGPMFGRQIAAGGDINGDGFLDMVISNSGDTDSPTGYSSAEFFYGNDSGIDTIPFTSFERAQQGKLYGFEMAFVGDVHGDGYDDVIITELYASTPVLNMGKVHMWCGSATGPVANWTETGGFANALLGYTVSPAGDINEDGYDDFFMMYPSASKSGTVNLYLGSENGPRSDTQLLVQGAVKENVGLNLLSGMDLDGDGMGEILYSSRDLSQGDEFAPVLTIMSERDWENINFGFDNEVMELDLKTPLRGSPSLMVKLSDSSLNLLENTPDGLSSAGRWDHRYLTDVDSAVMGITDAGKPTILATSTISGSSTLISMTPEGNTGLDFTLDSGTGVGKQMGSILGSTGLQRMGHTSPDYSSIFYTVEGEYGYTTSLVRSSIDVLYPVQIHIDSSDNTRLVYVDDDDHMVRLSTLDSSWSEVSILNTTLGDDFDSVWTSDDDLILAQVGLSNNSTYLQLVEYNGTNYTVSDVASADLTASFEMEIIGDKLVISVLDGEYLNIHERNLTGGNWTNSFQRWMLQDSNNANNTLVMRDGYILYDSNNNDEGIAYNSEGTWAVHSIEVPDSENDPDFLVISDGSEERWHITHTESSLAQNHLVWTTGMLSQSGITTSTSFTSISTEHRVAIESYNGDLMLAYSQSSTNNFLAMRIVSDSDRDLVPDTHDDLPMIGNQWEDSDSDGFGDNSEGPQADMCPSSSGHSKFDRHGCDDYDQDGWSDANDDCVSDDGFSWWGQLGCDDDDQDGWVDDGILGDRYPTNWKQALDTDRDSYGDNHGPDCCNVTVLGVTEVNVPDLFPYNRMQWEDNDNDGYGDNESDVEFGDKCWWIEGYSWRDRLGCVDSDGDGASDASDFGTFREWNIEDGADKWPDDPTQWADSDGDGYGDNSSDGATLPDKFPNNPAAAVDTDNDGYPNNWTELDNGSNRDGLVLDNCPDVFGNSTSSAVGDNVVPYYGCIDTDGDGREDSTDAFPADPTQVADSDGDGWGDNQLGNDPDACPYDFGFINGTKPDGTPGIGCPIEGEEEDQDQDGVSDEMDNCDNTPSGESVDEVGCSESQKDDDLDGVSNDEDKCANTPINTAVDTDGCSSAQKEVDTDGDGVNDPDDLCPDSNPELSIDENGCNLAQKDTDGDGVNDLMDQCPGTEIGIPVLANGCLDEAALAVDIDGDGYKGPYFYDAVNDTHEGDAFPLDATQWNDKDGDGYGDSQAIGANNSDSCPDVWGNSTMKSRLGCLDSDGDGYSDLLGDDKFPTNPTQWADNDLDSWGDNPDGEDADQCLNTSTAGDRTAQARDNFGCALYQSDSDNDGVMDDIDACPNTPAGAEVYPSGCKKEVEAEPTDDGELIMGMEPMIFYAAVGGGGLLFIVLMFVIISRMRGGDFDFDDDDDDDDWFDDDDDEDDFMSSILGGRGASRGPSRGPGGPGPNRGPQRGPQAGPSRGPAGPGPSSGPPGAGPTRGPNRGPPGAGPTRGPSGPSRGPVGTGPMRGPDPRGPARGGTSPRSPAQGKKVVAKRKLVGSEAKARGKVTIDPDLFDQDEIEDRKAAVDWTRTALKGGVSERSILMQLQTTGWSAPQSRAIIDLSKQ